MGYEINITFMELQTAARVTIRGGSEFSKSAQISQFQCIGWLLSITRLVNAKVDPEWLVNPDYAVEALVRVGGLSEAQAVGLMKTDDLGQQFRHVWSCLSDDEKKCAIHMNFDHYDNFWPGFDHYSHAWAASLNEVAD
ncbi:hypothetical protein ACIF81_07295 [Pseudomonas juntendi]|uniref:hypothetical protein n=1 Tax=Pseudomonas juntendi TaxID=2666183 RepID=UPI0018D95032|nr:hypothetical protein [Pseudomonas juntendi]MBH3372424.1 hypothetical protein [Pseudomonas juntendi]